MMESLKRPRSAVPKARDSANVLVRKCLRAVRPVFEKGDRAALWRVVAASRLLFVSCIATILAIILKLEGFGRGPWLTMAVVALVCSFTTTLLMVRDMLSSRKGDTNRAIGGSKRNRWFSRSCRSDLMKK
jgi:hypothetical protein